jgi:hypothetical protein
MTMAGYEIVLRIAGLLAMIGVLLLLVGQAGRGFALVMVALLLSVGGAIAVDYGDAISLLSRAWWAELPGPYRYGLGLASILIGLLFVTLVALACLRILARPFIGRAAADSMTAGLGVVAIRFLLGGFLVRLVRWGIRTVQGR